MKNENLMCILGGFPGLIKHHFIHPSTYDRSIRISLMRQHNGRLRLQIYVQKGIAYDLCLCALFI
jgi:hypothetical protein